MCIALLIFFGERGGGAGVWGGLNVWCGGGYRGNVIKLRIGK